MVIYLRHPVHGAKVAISDMEVAADLENGWEEFDPTTPAPDEIVEAPVNQLGPKRRRKTHAAA